MSAHVRLVVDNSVPPVAQPEIETIAIAAGAFGMVAFRNGVEVAPSAAAQMLADMFAREIARLEALHNHDLPGTGPK